MIVLRILLFPFAILYAIITGIRNRMYDQGIRPSVTFDLPVIGIGNLTVGGTGKTPLTEHLIRLLAEDHVVLSRGYGRKSTGFRIANPADNATTIGDEPYQFYIKYGEKITVTVGEERAYAIPNILQEHPKTEIILLDDAYQHRRVKPSLNILLSDYHRPFYEDFLLPAGRLRESRYGAERADIVVVTKCPPEMTDEEMIEIEKAIREYADKPVFFTHIRYGRPMAFAGHGKMTDQVVLVSGISNVKPLVHYVRHHFKMVKHLDFNDHHTYSTSDLDRLKQYVKENPDASILTTEKDKVKLDSTEFETVTRSLPLFYLPIEVEFIKNGQDFDEIVLNSIKRVG
jgi:tetraacyldisaccharide 4'-kinase